MYDARDECMLKTDLHLHSSEDPEDTFIRYSAKDLVRYCAKLRFDVIALTLHNRVHYPRELVDFAKKKGITMIKGCEVTLEGAHVLVYNIDDTERKQLKTFDDLAQVRDHALIVAPHPYFIVGSCMGNKLVQYIDSFDGVEYSHFYCKHLNRNHKAVEVAEKYHKALLGNSDAHHLETINTTFSRIDADATRDSVFEAIRKRKVEVCSTPLSTLQFVWKGLHIVGLYGQHCVRGERRLV